MNDLIMALLLLLMYVLGRTHNIQVLFWTNFFEAIGRKFEK